jgi:hypothetical protein
LVLQRSLTLLLISLLTTPAVSYAQPKPLDPGTVHVKIIKRGVNNWIALQENNGVQLFGRILAIDDHSFTLQLHNDPQTTEILYSDVVYLQTGMTAGQKAILFGGLAAVAGGAIYGFVHIHNLNNKPLPTPTPPPFP